MKATGLILLTIAGVLIGSYAGFAITVASMETAPRTNEATPLKAVYYHEAGIPVVGSELQGGGRQELQVTADPQPAEADIQGNNSDGFRLQPAISLQ